MSALTVLIMRHAEKPGGLWPGSGSAEDGTIDARSLVIRGWQRAGAWASLFGPDGAYPRPDVIYAANPAMTPQGEHPSARSLQTATPLALRLGLNPIATFGRGDEAALAKEILSLTGIVLVVWEHKMIVAGILPGLLNGQKPAGTPAKWDGERFDVVLRLDRALPGAPWSFRQLFPRLLSGDSDVPLRTA